MSLKKIVFGMMIWIGLLGNADPVRPETAQEPDRFDLVGCIRQALRSNPSLEEARLGIDEANVKLEAARLVRTPDIELFNRTGIVQDAVGDGVTGDQIDDEFGPFNRLEVMFTLPIYTFGRIGRSIKAAGENLDRQRASEAKTAGDLILDVHRRYYGYVVTRQLSEATESIHKNFAEAYEAAEERLEKGDPLVTETDALKLKVGMSVVTSSLHKVRRELRVAKASLRQIMGMDDRVDFAVADERLEPVEFDPAPLALYLKQAREENPSIRQVRAAVSAEESLYLAENSKYYPTLLAVGGLRHAIAPGREDQDNPFLNDDYNFFDAGLSLGIKWDLDFWKTKNSLSAEKLRYLKMKSRLNGALDSISLSVEEKYHRYTEKKDNLEASFEAKKAGRALLFLNLTNFRLGIGSGKDVFDALSLHARVDGEYFQAVFEYNMAVVELLNAVGKLTPDAYL
ncbi:MAG: TolC family protein [Desulfobacteraceae bacterium]|nr:MAG: TolC family protein [Desulfobacteraceae bacterium]